MKTVEILDIDFNSNDIDRILASLVERDREILLAIINSLAELGDGNDAEDMRSITGCPIEMCEHFAHVSNVVNEFLFNRPNLVRPKIKRNQ